MKNIEDTLKCPEGKTLEFKRDLSSLKPILKTLIAFANTSGGSIVIGVEDDGTVSGISDVFLAEEKIANAISDNIEPRLLPEIESISIGKKSLLVVSVSRWLGPFYLKSQGRLEGAYVRLGSTNRIAGPELLQELERSNSTHSFDQLPCQEADPDCIDMKLVEKIFSKSNHKIDQKKLISLGVLVSQANKIYCSNGGIILFGNEEIRQKIFPNAGIRCARFSGTEKIDFIDQYDVPGSIITGMAEVPKFIRRNMRIASKIDKIERDDYPEYPTIAIREVLTNALVHADYSLKGMHTRIMIFANRMEIESPGMLPFGYTLEDFEFGVSHVRNKVIARVFRELGWMEEWGTGYKRITHSCETEGYEIPSWKEVGTTVKVTFTPHSLTQNLAPIKIQTHLSNRQIHIVNILKEYSDLPARDIHSKLEQSLSERTLRYELNKLQDLKIIHMIGNGPNTSWKLNS